MPTSISQFRALRARTRHTHNTRSVTRLLTLASALIGATIASTLPAQSIDTRNGQTIYAVTTPNFGQVFTAPLGASVLTQFSFFLQPNTDVGGTATFQAFIAEWNGNRPIGALLYSSGSIVTPACCTFAETPFNTGGIAVTPGSMYVAYITPTVGTLVEGFARNGDDYADSYGDGYFVYNPGCTDSPTTCDWARSNQSPNIDMEFVAQFASASTVVPEPSTLMLVALGFGSVLLFGARRFRRV